MASGGRGGGQGRGQARSQRQLGRSQLGIRHRLRQHRLDDTIIDTALDAADQHTANGELLAACVFARRRRLGPFDRRHYDNADDRQTIMQRQQRQIGSMARAGFAISISRKVISLDDMAAAELLIDQLKQGEDPTV